MAEEVRVGEVVDNCRIEAQLGEGGFGAVYRATHLALEQPRALKFLFAAHGANPELRRRFLNEARYTARLDHPNIVTVHNIGEHEGAPYINMEFVSGTSLAARLARNRVPMDETLRIIDQILAGLAFAHQSGLVHRDVKPENTIVRQDGHVKVVDFGLSLNIDTAASRVTMHTKARMGTPFFMAPEQWSTSSVGATADVWSVGVMLYELLSGKLPFAGETLMDVMMSIAREHPRPLVEVDPGVSPTLSELVDRMLAKSPGGRPRDGGHARQQLHAAAPQLLEAHRIVQARKPARPQPITTIAPARQLAPTEFRVQVPKGLQAIAEEGCAERFLRQCDSAIMVLLPGADVVLGSDGGDADERPCHRVRLSPFMMDTTPVTRRQFAAFLSLWGSDQDDEGHKLLDPELACIERAGLIWEPSAEPGDPVTGVTWHGAETYADWARMALTSEAQLEFTLLRMAENPDDEVVSLLDRLIGTVRYWCADTYDDRYYARCPEVDPVNREPGAFAAIRGLSRHMEPLEWSRTRRQMNGRHEPSIDLGFRCVYLPQPSA